MSDHEPSIREVINTIASEESEQGPTGWVFDHRITRAERSTALRNVLLDSDPRWFVPFLVMLGLSASIAALGLSQDSAATVIGAMVIAPLGQPMAALGAAIALAWPREAMKMFMVTLAGALVVVGIAFLIGLLLPTATPSGQILSRTHPDLRDLGVALFAGAAGAYAQTRSSLSSTLTGVAIAVAVVPPLAAAGLMFEEGRFALAQGAVLLFVANLVGLVLASSMTLLLTGFAPMPRLRRAGWRSVVLVGSALGLAALVATPLTATYLRLVDASTTTTAVQRQIVSTLGSQSDAVLEKVEVADSKVTIDVSGGTNVPSDQVFAEDLTDELGSDVTVTVNRH